MPSESENGQLEDAGAWEKNVDDREFAIVQASKKSGIFGAYTGGAGFLYGSVTGILFSKHPILFTAISTVQWTACGATYAALREYMLFRTEHSDRAKPFVSAFAASMTGAGLATVMRKPASIIPAAAIWGLAGAAGQIGVDLYSRRDLKAPEPKEDNTSIWDWKWSPLKRIGDDDYEVMLKEKLLRINVRIAIIDEDIAKLRSEDPPRNTFDP